MFHCNHRVSLLWIQYEQYCFILYSICLNLFGKKLTKKSQKKYQNETEQDKMVETYKENKKGNKICYS